MRLFYTIILSAFLIGCNSPADRKTEPVNIPDQKTIVHKKFHVVRDNYSFDHYSNWQMDSSDVDFDIDSFFTLNGPVENGFITFFVFNAATDEKNNVDAQVAAHLKKTMKNATVTYFDKWGRYTGHGAIMKGKLLGVFKSQIRIFSFSTPNSSFIMIAEYEDSESELVLPGLELIETTFKLKI